MGKLAETAEKKNKCRVLSRFSNINLCSKSWAKLKWLSWDDNKPWLVSQEAARLYEGKGTFCGLSS